MSALAKIRSLREQLILAGIEQKWPYNKCSGLAILVSNVEYPGSVKHKGKSS